MTYSLVSAPVLGFDLARLPGGAAAAEILTAALALRTQDVRLLAACSPPDTPARRAARDRATLLELARPSVRDLAALEPAEAIGLLERAPIGSLAALLHCVRTDVLVPDRDDAAGAEPAPEPAVTTVCDAVSTAYLRELMSDADRRLLAAGWVSAHRRLPRVPLDLGPQHRAVHALLDRVRTLDADRASALTRAAGRLSPGPDWPAAMHSVTWAVHLSGRIRAAAAAQLLLVSALDLAGVPRTDRAAGVWNLLSGAVAALVVRDLADAASVHELLVPCLSALGSGWLSPG